jgi:hypothetical protein
MPDARRDLRATADALRRDLDALVTLEDDKRGLALDDPRASELARQIEEIAARVLAETADETDLTKVVRETGASGTIETTRRSTADILADWRELERRNDAVEPGSAEAAELAILLAHIREEYRAAVSASRAPWSE